MMKKLLILAAIICALALALSSCVVIFTSEDDQGFTFTSNLDGTCYLRGMFIDRAYGNIVIPETSPKGDIVTSIKEYAFSDCESLTSIEIPASVTYIGRSAFSRCKSLTSIEIPASVTYIDNYAFRDCTSLTSVTFAEGSQLTDIGEESFYYCTSLTGIERPASVTYIGCSAFKFCQSLASVNFAEGSQLTDIGYEAFRGCTSLTSIEIPTSVTSIGSSAFWHCPLTDVYYTGSEEEWAKISVGSGNDYLTNATIHYNYVPEE